MAKDNSPIGPVSAKRRCARLKSLDNCPQCQPGIGSFLLIEIMEPTKAKSRTGLYLSLGLGVLLATAAIFALAGGPGEENAPAPNEPIIGEPGPVEDNLDSCLAYAKAVGQLNDKYETEINAFWQAAHEQARFPAGDDPAQSLAGAREQARLQNYDVELNALRAEYGQDGYSFDEGGGLETAGNNPDKFCPRQAAPTFDGEVDRLRDLFDLDGHSAAVDKLNEQHQLAEFVAQNQVPDSTAPWAPPHADGTGGEPLADWTDEQKQAVLADANEHRLKDYLAGLDQLQTDHNLGVFESLLTDLEVRYNLNPSWLAQGGELILLTHIYNQKDANYFTISHIRDLLEEPASSD